MIDKLFIDCVRLLHWIADRFGTTYEAINVWIFIVLWPIFTLALIVVVILQQMKIHELLGR
jgi:hypothetical protein